MLKKTRVFFFFKILFTYLKWFLPRKPEFFCSLNYLVANRFKTIVVFTDDFFNTWTSIFRKQITKFVALCTDHIKQWLCFRQLLFKFLKKKKKMFYIIIIISNTICVYNINTQVISEIKVYTCNCTEATLHKMAHFLF